MPPKPINLALLALAPILMLLCAVIVGTIVGAGALLLRWTGNHFAIPWLANADRDMLKLLSILFFLLPACIFILPRINTVSNPTPSPPHTRRGTAPGATRPSAAPDPQPDGH